MHVLFDETNSLVEDDEQIEGFEIGLARKELLPAQKGGKNPGEGLGLGGVSAETGQGLEQTGASTAEPCLEQNHSNIPETGSGTGI